MLDFKKEIFKGVLDEGGEDRVMLEGFLQSVKAMLDVNLEDPVEQETVDQSFFKFPGSEKVEII